MSISPLYFTGILPLYWHIKKSLINIYVFSVMFIFPGLPDASIRLAVFTVPPQISYDILLLPNTPAITGPVSIPILKSQICSESSRVCLFNSFMKFCISIAARTISTGFVLFLIGIPPAHIYASPIVLIFSILNFSTTVSN